MIEYNPSKWLSQREKFEIITSEKRVNEIIQLVKASPDLHALDFETTSLNPEEGEVRITSIFGPVGFFVIDHFKSVPFDDVADDLADIPWAVCNAGFEGRWFDSRSSKLVKLYDIVHLRKAIMGGGPTLSLKEIALRDANIPMDKTEQSSNWAKPEVTPEQYAYAGFDAVATYAVYDRWVNELSPQQWGGYLVLNDCWRATAEAEDNGLQLDIDYHKTLVEFWQRKFDLSERYLRKWAPPSLISNLQANQQIGKFIKDHIIDDAGYRAWPKTGKTGQMDVSRDTLRQAAYRLPYPMNRWLAALIIFNKARKYLSTYGTKLIDNQNRFGRIKSRFNIAAAVTGRYSSSADNLQNIPNSEVVRRSFVADRRRPNGGDKATHVYCIRDYSSIEVRTLAEIANDDNLRQEAIYGNIHATSAADMLHMDPAEFRRILKDKTDSRSVKFGILRKRAKATTFSVCYGAGIPSLAISLKVTDAEAAKAMEAWGKRYPKAYGYRQYMFEKLLATGFINVHDGRTIYVHKSERTLPVASNYGIQGAAASVMCRAMYHVHMLLHESGIQAVIAATVHDEILVRSRVECAEEAMMLLERGMVLGWLDIFPGSNVDNLSEGAIGPSWASKA
jgi:DNA polymerase I